MRRVLIILIGFALLAAACGSDSDDGSATRPVDGEDAYAIADLTVVISHPDAEEVSYTISCLGDTAGIVGDANGLTGEPACVALKSTEVVERLVQGAPGDLVCTEQYGGPDVATITGSLGGAPVDTSIDRVDGCGIGDWDILLAAILPPALGFTE